MGSGRHCCVRGSRRWSCTDRKHLRRPDCTSILRGLIRYSRSAVSSCRAGVARHATRCDPPADTQLPTMYRLLAAHAGNGVRALISPYDSGFRAQSCWR
ncbi:MAG: hypothetical protein ACRDTS_11800 [Mycobacterium sp.]